MNSKPRAATIYWREECYFATLNRDDYQKNIGKAQKKKIEEKTTFLQSFRIFSHFTLQTLQKLTYYIEEIKFNLGQIIYKQGDEPDGVYLVKEGEFEMTK